MLVALLVAPIALFLVQAISPRMFDQGPAWFTLAPFAHVFSGILVRGLVNSLWVSTVTACGSLVIALTLAWGVHRTTLPGRRVWPILIWVLLLMPSFLVAEGWEYLLQPRGILDQFGVNPSAVYHVFFGPFGVVFILTMSVVPFAYLAVSATILNLGAEFEEAARVHGAGPLQTALGSSRCSRPRCSRRLRSRSRRP